jgi:hypothetical protein
MRFHLRIGIERNEREARREQFEFRLRLGRAQRRDRGACAVVVREELESELRLDQIAFRCGVLNIVIA